VFKVRAGEAAELQIDLADIWETEVPYIKLITSPQRFHHGAINRLLGLEILFVIVAAGIPCDGLEEIPDGVEWQQAGIVEVNVGG
jgi:hypothetical protein